MEDGSTVLFRYYLLGGDTAAPSELLARLCHAFLVIIIIITGLNLTKFPDNAEKLLPFTKIGIAILQSTVF